MKFKGYWVGLFLLSQTGRVAAQECLQQPLSLTNLPAPPTWFKPPAASTLVYKELLQDPRWSGAPLRTFPVSSGGSTADLDDGMVRLVAFGSTAVYVSFQARSDDNTGTQDYQDAVYLGMTEGTGNGAHILQITPDWTTPAPKATSTPHDTVAPVPVDRGFIQWFSTTDPATVPWSQNSQPPSPAPAVPSWLHDVATWRSSPGVRWGVTFWIDLSDPSIHVTTAMKMFWGMQIHNTAGSVLLGSNALNPAPDPAHNNTIVPNLPSGWTQMATVGTTCTQGVTLDAADVGVWDGSSVTSTVCASGPGCTGTNVFRTIARNVAGQSADEFALRVRLRMAEWGSTITDPSKAAWRDIPLSNPPSLAMTTATVGQLQGNGWVWSYACTGDATIDYTCNIGAGNSYCPKLTNASDTSVLLFAEAVQPGTTYEIDVPSALRSMTYAGLSTVQQPATISLKGLETGSGPQKERDVYLFTDDSNLPPAGDMPIKLDGKAMTFVRSFAEHPVMPLRTHEQKGKPGCGQPEPKPRPVEARADGKKKEVLKNVARPFVVKADDPVLRLIQNPTTLAPGVDTTSLLSMRREQALDTVWPTRRVRVYYDTGKTITTHGLTSKVLQPMVPFGYRFSHDGALYGFNTKLEGLDGCMLEPLSDHSFRVKIRDGESVRIVQTISAEERAKSEPPPPPPVGPTKCPECKVAPGGHCNCTVPGRSSAAAASLASVAALATALLLRRRRSRRGS